MIQVLKNDFRILSTVAIFVVLISVRDILMIPISDTVLTGITVLFMLWLPFEKLIYFSFFLFPFTCGIPGYIMLLAFVMLLVKGPFLNRSQFIPLVLIALLEFLVDFTSGADSLSEIISFLSFTAIFFYFLFIKGHNINIPKSILFFSIGICVTLGIIVFNMVSQYGIIGVLSGALRSGALGIQNNDATFMKGHIALNANSLAYYSLCAATCLIVTFRKISANKYLLFSLIFISLLLGFISFSRTYILCLLLFFVCYFSFVEKKTKARFVMLALGALIFFIVFFSDYLLVMIDSFTSRTQEESFASAGGRTTIFSSYNEKWFSQISYILFGCGVVNHRTILQMNEAMHCGIQQIWVCLGLTGFLTFTICIVNYLKRYIMKDNLIILLPFSAVLLFDQSIQFLIPSSLMLPIIPTLLVCRLNSYYEN